MKRLLTIITAVSLLTGCAPSLQYRLGQGFYSDKYAKVQVQALANKGKVRNLGHFSIVKGGCGNYTQDAADKNIVIPAIKEKLQEMGANVADNVVANEQWYDFFLGLLVVPGLLACTNWTISGEALLVEDDALSQFQNLTKLSEAGEPSLWARFRKQ